VHADAPACDADPAWHWVQEVDPSVEKLPAAQTPQPDDNPSAATFEAVPAGQRVHAIDPVTFLYVPVLHAVHESPVLPVYPGRHVQLDRR
jgi:hypothetical protein